MNYLCLMDFDNTFKSNNDIDLDTKNFLNTYLINNKLCIISESSIDEITKYLNKINIKCDIYSLSDSSYIIDNKIKISLINHNIINDIISRFDNGIYTLYFKSNNVNYVYKYQERLELLYPKGYKLYENNYQDINYINIALDINYKDMMIDFIKNNDLFYDILGIDKNRIFIRIKNDNFNKENAYHILTNHYKNYKTIGITDSTTDYPMIEKCDIKVAMINGDKELKNKADIITDYDNNEFGSIKILKKICHL